MIDYSNESLNHSIIVFQIIDSIAFQWCVRT
jgi:hypothetical protein